MKSRKFTKAPVVDLERFFKTADKFENKSHFITDTINLYSHFFLEYSSNTLAATGIEASKKFACERKRLPNTMVIHPTAIEEVLQ